MGKGSYKHFQLSRANRYDYAFNQDIQRFLNHPKPKSWTNAFDDHPAFSLKNRNKKYTSYLKNQPDFDTENLKAIKSIDLSQEIVEEVEFNEVSSTDDVIQTFDVDNEGEKSSNTENDDTENDEIDDEYEEDDIGCETYFDRIEVEFLAKGLHKGS